MYIASYDVEPLSAKWESCRDFCSNLKYGNSSLLADLRRVWSSEWVNSSLAWEHFSTKQYFRLNPAAWFYLFLISLHARITLWRIPDYTRSSYWSSNPVTNSGQGQANTHQGELFIIHSTLKYWGNVRDFKNLKHSTISWNMTLDPGRTIWIKISYFLDL